MSTQTAIETYTVHDYRLWEGDWELIHGQPVGMAPSPGLTHQTLSMGIARQLDEALALYREALALAGPADEVYVFGGGTIYAGAKLTFE